MITKCYKCGEVKECKNYPLSLVDYALGILSRERGRMWVCELCVKAVGIINSRIREQENRKVEKSRKEWIKQRDKIIKELKGGKENEK